MIYISGPMTGYPDWNYPAFNEAAEFLKSKGYEVFNPAEIFEGRTDLPRHVYMKEDIKALLECDTVMLLKGWEESQGALLEVDIAFEIGLPVLELDLTAVGDQKVKVVENVRRRSGSMV
jgi:hypothetical protein